MIRIVSKAAWLIMCLVWVGVISAETTAPSATITVNSTLDNIAFDGQCTLREAIENAEFDNLTGSPDCLAGIGADTIVFDFGGVPTTITITRQLDLKSEVTIDGIDESVTIAATHASDPTFYVDAPGNAVTFRGFTLIDANTASTGSAIATPFRTELPHNVVFIDQMILRDNYGQNGGAILAGSRTTLDILDSQFIDNTAVVDGGAIASYHANIVKIRNTTFRDNVAEFSGGGVGGAISQANTSQSIGSLEITNSIFDNNRADGDSEGPGSLAAGGAIYNSGRSFITIVSSTFSRNRAQNGGAIYSFLANSLAISNSTFSANTAEFRAGGIWLDQSSASIAYSTFYRNSAPNPGQALWLADNPSGIFMTANIVSKSGGISFIYDSCARSLVVGDVNPLTSGGGNIVDGCADQLTDPTDQQIASISSIGALANNGGVPAPLTPPLTHAITSDNSPAYDAKQSCSLSADQRGAARSSPACDAGAFEFGSVPLAVGLSANEATNSNTNLEILLFVIMTLITKKALRYRSAPSKYRYRS